MRPQYPNESVDSAKRFLVLAWQTVGLSRPLQVDNEATFCGATVASGSSARLVGFAWLWVSKCCSSRKDRRAELAKAERGKLRELLLAQQRQDFEHGRIVKVQGWILSETEARLCTLAALI